MRYGDISVVIKEASTSHTRVTGLVFSHVQTQPRSRGYLFITPPGAFRNHARVSSLAFRTFEYVHASDFIGTTKGAFGSHPRVAWRIAALIMIRGWFSLKKPRLIPRRMSTPFFRFRPWNFAHVFYMPLRRPHLICLLLFFFCLVLRPLFFLGNSESP